MFVALSASKIVGFGEASHALPCGPSRVLSEGICKPCVTRVGPMQTETKTIHTNPRWAADFSFSRG